MKQLFIIIVSIGFLVLSVPAHSQSKRWPAEKANKWYAGLPWLRGCNFQPSTAINQLEMFQAATFDTVTINRELAWAENLGFNVVRVYLHHLLWTNDRKGFKTRIDNFLRIASSHGIQTMFVFFDDCWNDTAWVGKQPDPKPGVHNSGWLRDPGTMLFKYPDTLNTLEIYVKDILHTFKNDRRILMWDLYNEPGGNYQFNKSLPLLRKVFQWARSVNPDQPITSGVWSDEKQFDSLNAFQLSNSDVITYHNYQYIDQHIKTVDSLQKYGRPIICTEYMARKAGSLFQLVLPMLKEKKVGAINWGFVSGKTNTIYSWDKVVADGSEPALWFHDILRRDGSPFSDSEINIIKTLCSKQNPDE